MELVGIQRKLSEHKNGTGRLWHFSASHDRLAIELGEQDGRARAYLVLLGCTHINVPTLWKMRNPTISLVGEGFLFRDAAVQVLFTLEALIQPEYRMD
jgi:hypothetical protein